MICEELREEVVNRDEAESMMRKREDVEKKKHKLNAKRRDWQEDSQHST